MAIGQWAGVLRQVGRAFGAGTVAGLSEGQLLDRFLAVRDEAAFEALLVRHGPMVLGVCRSTLDDPRDVEDAFQATFLILVRRGEGLRDRDLLGPWLFGVARKVARRARLDAGRRRARERPGAVPDLAVVQPDDFDLRERRRLVRDEVARLPDRERSAVVLCDLEGLTHEEAAARLGWPLGTVKGRLSRARDRLARRLARRGVGLPALAVASELARDASAALPAHLIRSTTLAATRSAAGKTLAAGIVSAQAQALTEGVLRTMLLTTPWKAAALLVAAGCTVAAPALFAGQDPGPIPAASPAETPKGGPAPDIRKAAIEIEAAAPPEVPAKGDAAATVERLASEALRDMESRAQATLKPISVTDYIRWSGRLAQAQGTFGQDGARAQAALNGHLVRMKKLKQFVQGYQQVGQLTNADVLEATYQIIEAEAGLAPSAPVAIPDPGPALGAVKVEASAAPSPLATPALGPVRPVRATSRPSDRSAAIYAKLRESFAIHFPEPTALREVLEAITRSTKDPAAGLPDGVGFYVAPLEGVALTRRITIDVAEIPLRTALDLIVKQVGMEYLVKDGLVLIALNRELANIQRDLDPGVIHNMGGVAQVQDELGGSSTETRITSYRVARVQNAADQERNKAVRAWLDRSVPIRLGGGASLGEAIREIKGLTQVAGEKPIPIYVDPLGLQAADKTMEAPVALELEGVPLRTTLRLMLAQLGLVYLIDQWMLVITQGDPAAMAAADDDNSASPDVQAKTAMIVAKLETPVPIRFPKETPLADVLKAIQEATKGPGGTPIPIYVDPQGLAKTENTMTSPVVMDIEGVPLRTTLRALVAQLHLKFEVKGGLLQIGYDDTEDKEEEARQKQQEQQERRQKMGGGMGGMGGMM